MSTLAAAGLASIVSLHGYLETYFQWNAHDPSNDVTALRAFDARHDTFALQNAVLEADWTEGPVSGRLALQAGDAGDIYVPATDASFRHVQEAWVAWAAPAQLELAAGLFLSPVGPEVVPTKDDWQWSRSDLFAALPAYHLGVRVKRPLGDSGWSIYALVSNGWSDIVDDNRGKSIAVAAAYARGPWIAQVLYLGGPERPRGAPEGQPWRHLVDAYVQGPAIGALSFLVHADAGVESNAFGTSSWLGGAAYAKYDVTPTVYAAIRVDAFHESRPAAASAIFFPAATVGSGTITVAYRPAAGLDLRVEARHDHASSDVYFGGAVAVDPATGAQLPNRSDQLTFTAGAIAWF